MKIFYNRIRPHKLRYCISCLHHQFLNNFWSIGGDSKCIYGQSDLNFIAKLASTYKI